MRQNIVILGGRTDDRRILSFERDSQARVELLDSEQAFTALHRIVIAPITRECSHIRPTVEWRRGEGL